ncbi:UbiA family prenyltransferase [Singulisphaera rosea]
MTIKPYLQLVRLPNVFTAAADSLAGWLIVQGSFESPERWLPLLLSSMTIYAAGIALNDVFDYEIDLKERPNRPIPSGQVSRKFAAWLGGGLLTAGPLLALASGSASSFFVALILSLSVLAYDVGVKRTVLGPEVMGLCRGLNFLLGMSQAPDLGGPTAWLVASSLATFVTGVTWISRWETETGRVRGLLAGMILENLGLFGLVLASLPTSSLNSNDSSNPPSQTLQGVVVLILVAWVVNLASARALRTPIPGAIQRAVKTGVLSLVWLNVGVVAAVRGVGPAFVVALLWVPAFRLGRWLYST